MKISINLLSGDKLSLKQMADSDVDPANMEEGIEEDQETVLLGQRVSTEETDPETSLNPENDERANAHKDEENLNEDEAKQGDADDVEPPQEPDVNVEEKVKDSDPSGDEKTGEEGQKERDINSKPTEIEEATDKSRQKDDTEKEVPEEKHTPQAEDQRDLSPPQRDTSKETSKRDSPVTIPTVTPEPDQPETEPTVETTGTGAK